MRKSTMAGVVALVVLGGCSKRSEVVREQAGAAPSVAIQDAAPSTPPPPPPRVIASRAFATFGKDKRLDECTDASLIAPPDSDRARVEKAADAAFKVPSGALRLSGSCESQFADRTVLASCLITRSGGDGGDALSVAILSSYYSVRTLDDDSYMRDCLTAGGQWEAAKKDDSEAARERIRQRAKGLQDLAERAGRAP